MNILSDRDRKEYKISRTWMEINLDKLENNLLFLRSIEPADVCIVDVLKKFLNKDDHDFLKKLVALSENDKDTDKNISIANRNFNKRERLTAVIKADAYGHGAPVIAKFISEKGLAKRFAVASIDEAIQLREAGICEDIEILSMTPQLRFDDLLDYSFIQVISSQKEAEILNELAYKKGKSFRVHLALDTGMGRIGLDIRNFFSYLRTFLTENSANEDISSVDLREIIYRHNKCMAVALETAIEISKLNNINFEACITHFPSADAVDDSETQGAFVDFYTFVSLLNFCIDKKIMMHCANSAFFLRHSDLTLDYYRPGIILYGLLPECCSNFSDKLKGISELKAEITYVKTVDIGDKISYGGTYICDESCKIATVACGYADGYSRGFSNIGNVRLDDGSIASIVGRVCMDSMMIKLPLTSTAKEGDIVTLYTSEYGDTLGLYELAEIENTIHYELSCRVSPRVTRAYFYKNKLYAVSSRDKIIYILND